MFYSNCSNTTNQCEYKCQVVQPTSHSEWWASQPHPVRNSSSEAQHPQISGVQCGVWWWECSGGCWPGGRFFLHTHSHWQSDSTVSLRWAFCLAGVCHRLQVFLSIPGLTSRHSDWEQSISVQVRVSSWVGPPYSGYHWSSAATGGHYAHLWDAGQMGHTRL